MKIKLILILLVLTASNAMAQLDYKSVDQRSYDYYTNAQWDSLIHLGKEAIKQDIDYYYLNYRIGLAYFSKNKFFPALFYLEKALKQNQEALNDPYFQEHLYLSYIYTLQYDRAMQVPIDSSRTNLKSLLLNSSIIVFGGGGSAVPIDNDQLLKIPEDDLSFNQYQQGQTIWGAAIQHQLYPWLDLRVSYSNVQFNDVASVDVDDSLTIKTYTIYQQNISIIPEFTFGSKWRLSIAFAYSFNSGEPYSFVQDYSDGTYYFVPWKFDEENYLLGLNLYKTMKNVTLGLELGTSNYSNTSQKQFGLNLAYYPLGNMNLYSFTSASVKLEKSNTDFIFYQKIGVKVVNKLWFEAAGTFGEIKNYNVFSLGYGYNTTDKISMLVNAKAIYLLSKNIELFAKANYFNRQGLRTDVNLDPGNAVNSFNYDYGRKSIDYQYWSVSGGIIWKFKI